MPDAALLDSVRDLPNRFPIAMLRKVVLIRATQLGARVWLALESLQVTGSFKVRGALVAMAHAISKRHERVVTASAGNHGAGISFASNVLQAQATVYVPKGAPEAKKTHIRRYGAELVVCDAPGYDEVEVIARAEAKRTEVPFISPYDDVHVLAGNGASLAFEIMDALHGAPAVVIAPFGGGGLASGLACGFRHAKANTRVWGAQSAASCAMAMSIDRGEAVTELPAVDTLAEALEGGISKEAFARATRLVDGVIVVSERLIAIAMDQSKRELGLTIEGGAAAAYAPLVGGLPDEVKGEDIVILLTGRNVDAR